MTETAAPGGLGGSTGLRGCRRDSPPDRWRANRHCQRSTRTRGSGARTCVRPPAGGLQWNALAKITAITGAPPDQIGAAEFERARTAIIDAYVERGLPQSGRNMASIFHRLQLTLFHAGRLDTHCRPMARPPVSVSGWSAVAPGFADTARRYVAQVDLSLRPATVKHIEADLREFGTWLAESHPHVASCADLDRLHIEAYKAWVATKHGRQTGKPLSRISIKNRLINLHCFFDRITYRGKLMPLSQGILKS